MTSTRQQNITFISLGANIDGAWGKPKQSVYRALRELEDNYGTAFTTSRCYATPALGAGRQPGFVNVVAKFATTSSPAEMLRTFKVLERRAGRAPGLSRRWAPRPLDIDLIDCGGRCINWHEAGRLRPGPLLQSVVLPHPAAHLRAFVLVPLAEIASHWWHPALRLPLSQLLLQLRSSDVRRVQPDTSTAIDSALENRAAPCDRKTINRRGPP